MASWLSLTIWSTVVALSSGASFPIVETSIGQVQGVEEFGVFKFLGIPFAEPPIGERRFAKPVPKVRMLETYNATYFRPSCPQLLLDWVKHLYEQDEDCLFMNIYTPINAALGPPKTVMLWVHGGSYIYGSGRDSDGTALASQQDVILVNINYRLGAFGFLNTKDENAGGNQGLWDQTMALEWVKRNIAAFGGDPERVTIFGESAGSSSVTQLAISPFTNGLFQRVIAESGTASAAWAAYDNSIESAQKLGRRFGCSTTTNKELVQCLRQIPAKDIANNQVYIKPLNAFAPTYGTDFLPYTVHELVTTESASSVAKRFAEIEFIIGQNSNEGSLFLKDFLRDNVFDGSETFDDAKGMSEELFERTLVAMAKFVSPNDPILTRKLIAPIRFKYNNWEGENDGITRTKSIVDIFSDTTFTHSIVTFSRAHVFLRQKWSPSSTGTYTYLFDYRGSWQPMTAWRSGADHADEIAFVFGAPLLLDFLNATQAEKDLTSKVMTYWTNFAKTGNPSTAGVTPWPVFNLDTEQYLKFDVGRLSTGEYLYNDRVEFWLDYFPKQIEIFKSEPTPVHC